MSEISWLQKPLQLSVNNRIYNKNELGDIQAFVEGWVNQELTIDQLAQSVRQGFAYSCQLKNTRNAKNFIASGVLSVDVDDGMTLQQAKDHPLVNASASLIYTSNSHTDDHHKFRIVFALENPIEDARSMSAAMRSLSLRLSGDPAATDAARLFYGNDQCHFETFNRGLTDQQVEELIEQSLNIKVQSTAISKTADGTISSALNVSHEQLIRTADGKMLTIDQIERKTGVYCCFHSDKNPSAVVVENHRGVKGLYCSRCGTTFWSGSNQSNVDFYKFDKVMKAIKGRYDFDLTEKLFNDNIINGTEVYYINDRFLPSPEKLAVTGGINFFKSPKGTGKTQFLEQIISQAKKDDAVLLIGHRRSLIRQMCKRLDLHCYLDDDCHDPATADVSLSRLQHRYGICLDSIMKLNSEITYKYVLIDESEQVFAHLLSETLSKRRNSTMQRLRYVLSRADHVFAMDADLDFPSFNYIADWSRHGKKDQKAKVFINEYIEDKGALEVYASRNHITGDMVQAVEQGKRCYITSNSKNFIATQTAALRNKHKRKKFLEITADTVQQGANGVAEFLENPAMEAIKYDAVLASPSVSTGVDITFPDEEQFYDVVYGVFEPLVLNHFEIDQQLGRVRHPKAVKVYVSPLRYFFEHEFDVVMQDMLSMTMMDHLVEGFDAQTGRPVYKSDDLLLEIACVLTSKYRKSVNNLRGHFIDYKSKGGWKIITVGNDDELSKRGANHTLLGRAISQENNLKGLLSADKIDDDQFEELWEKADKGNPFSEKEYFQFNRGVIERFYRQEIDAHLVEMDDNGRFRTKIKKFEALLQPKEFDDLLSTEKFIANVSDEPTFLLFSESLKLDFLRRCLSHGKIYESNTFKLDIEICSDDLNIFVDFIRDNKAEFESSKGRQINKDISNKPIKQLNSLLSEVGLSTTRTRKTRKGGNAVYFYQIDKEKYERNVEILNRRNTPTGG